MSSNELRDYLYNNNICSEEELAKHIEVLKHSEKNYNDVVFPLVDLLLNEKSVLISFFRENKIRFENKLLKTIKNSQYLEITDTSKGDISEQIKKCFENYRPEKFDKILFNHPLKEMLDNDQEEKSRIHSTRHKSKHGETHNNQGLYVDEVLERIEIQEHRNLTPKEEKIFKDWNSNSSGTCSFNDSFPYIPKRGKIIRYEADKDFLDTKKIVEDAFKGIKESQTVEKAPIFTYCKVNKLALEALSLRALHGHNKYEKGDDWENFARVPNGDFEYANAQFRHALELGGEEDKEQHLISSAWNAISRLEIYLRNKNDK